MIQDELADPVRTLLRSRGRILGESVTSLERVYSESATHELVEALKDAPRNQKVVLGFLLARAAFERAHQTQERGDLSRFLFRLGAHLKASVNEPGLSPAQRSSLAIAAEQIFNVLPTANPNQRAEVHEIRVRHAGPKVTDADWKATIGVTSGEFAGTIDQIARCIQLPASATSSERVSERPPLTNSSGPGHRPATAESPVPNWLATDFGGAPDRLVGATANWDATGLTNGERSDIAMAWSAFCKRDFVSAHRWLAGLLATNGSEWGPTSGADVLRTWNWIRLVVELSSVEQGTALDKRRSLASATSFAAKCLPDDSDLLEDLLSRSLDDFAARDMASARAWCSYAARLVAEVGHELALGGYSNSEKAQLRAAWSKQFDLAPEDGRSTATVVASFLPRLKEVTQRLYVGARSTTSPSRVLHEVSRALVMFLDERESDLFHDAVEAAEDSRLLVEGDSATHRDLNDQTIVLREVRRTIALSGSALLQDFVAPLIQVAMDRTDAAAIRLGDLSRPQISVQLTSSRVPFSATPGSSYHLRFVAQNSGNATAENIRVRVQQAEVGVDSVGSLDSLGPGAEDELTVTATANGASVGAVTLSCEVTWSDALLQQFSLMQLISAEDQAPVSWTAKDVNPFSLGTISDPHRLVGREEDLASLDALIAGGASAYITGHKRVGKTSLTRVLLKSIHEQRGWAGSLLPLGRALGQEQSAGDLVYALLDEVLGAARDAYADSVRSISEVTIDDSGNFARAANRWLRSVARALPADARVVIAIDDFDELPPHLVEGTQADALFLFLRSLVDEPWLNLIVVGSEVLPSIIQKQAHKLNQVVPVSVTNFSSRESMSALLVTPTSDRLEWSSEAIDRMHYLCSGNPYYGTLVAQRLWQSMRERSRSIVTAGDVDDAVGVVAREAPESHFIHLWADSSTGIDHAGRSAVVASAVLRSVARCGGEMLAPAATEEVVRIAAGWIQTATTDELQQAIGTLRSRDILESGPSEGSLLVTIPLVGVWLLNLGGKVLDGIYATSKHATATARMITDAELVELSRHLTYHGEHVTEVRLKAWLEQFGDNYHQYLAFRMLRRMILDGYFTSSKLQSTVLPRLSTNVAELGAARHLVREANNQALRNAYVIDHGVPGDSTQGTLSALAKTLKVKKANIVPITEIAGRVRGLDTPAVLFLLDDYSGTGTHLTRTLDELLGQVGDLEDGWSNSLHVVVGAGVVADESDLPRPETDVSIETVGGVFLGDRFRPFHRKSGVFSTDKERVDAEEMTQSIGRALMANNPLGFGGRALLTLFEFNCPNNVAPVFWRSGTVSGARWVPLFERLV